MLRIGSIVLRVDDLKRQTEFWEAALDYERSDVQDDDFILLRPRDGVGPNLSLDQVRSTLQIPPRLHLDLYTHDQAGEVERLKALGATEVHWDKRPPDADYVILADPEGNRFCVADISEVSSRSEPRHSAHVVDALTRALQVTSSRLDEMAREDGLAALNEAKHFQPTFSRFLRDVASTEEGIEVATQLPAKCADWPSLGGVDIALTVSPNKPVWVELKCGSGRDALGPCVWDAAKCAFGLARGDASAAYLVAGTSAATWGLPAHGAEFFDGGVWRLVDLRETYASWWRLWERDGYPAGRRVPAAFATEPVWSAAFEVAGSPWELRLARVRVADAVGWIDWPPLLATN